MMRLIMFAVVVVGVAGCTDQAWCAKRQQCDDKLNQDDENVCVAEQDRQIAMLRANHESECQALADALLNELGCEANLSCGDFTANDLGGNCKDEQAKLTDARNAAECGHGLDDPGCLCAESH
jgi:hypothetical protein